MLRKPVMLDDVVYGVHQVIEVTHNYAQGFTRITVESRKDEAAVDGTSRLTTLDLPLHDGMSEEGAYEAIDAQWPEYIDESTEALNEILDILTDEQAETVPQLYPEWKADISYALGKRVRYNDKLYRCVQAHTSQEGWEPPNVPALWVRTAAEGEIPEWVQPTGAHDAYNKGDKVRYEGKVWVSTMDANTYAPGVYGWDEVAE